MANDEWKKVTFDRGHGIWKVIPDLSPYDENVDEKVEPDEPNIGSPSPEIERQDKKSDGLRFYPIEIQIPADVYEGLLKYERLTGERLRDFIILVLRDTLTTERIAGLQALLQEKDELLQKQEELLQKEDERIEELKTVRPGFWPRAFRRKA